MEPQSGASLIYAGNCLRILSDLEQLKVYLYLRIRILSAITSNFYIPKVTEGRRKCVNVSAPALCPCSVVALNFMSRPCLLLL